MILGFGKHHEGLTEEALMGLGRELLATSTEDLEDRVKVWAKEQGTWGGKKWSVVDIQRVLLLRDYEPRGVVVFGVYNHYRDDHPVSPDGLAMLSLKFCLTVRCDDIWGDSLYVSCSPTEEVRRCE